MDPADTRLLIQGWIGGATESLLIHRTARYSRWSFSGSDNPGSSAPFNWRLLRFIAIVMTNHPVVVVLAY